MFSLFTSPVGLNRMRPLISFVSILFKFYTAIVTSTTTLLFSWKFGFSNHYLLMCSIEQRTETLRFRGLCLLFHKWITFQLDSNSIIFQSDMIELFKNVTLCWESCIKVVLCRTSDWVANFLDSFGVLSVASIFS